MARLSKSKERTEREKLRQTEREERKVNKIQGEKKKSRSQGRHLLQHTARTSCTSSGRARQDSRFDEERDGHER